MSERELLGSFVHLQVEVDVDPDTGTRTRTEKVLFPRHHQWRAVTRLVNAGRVEGPGKRYLVQHSAGSGKTNSIAWLAHRLSPGSCSIPIPTTALPGTSTSPPRSRRSCTPEGRRSAGRGDTVAAERTYPGKDKTFVLDFNNDPVEVLDAFLPYYRKATLTATTDPILIYDLVSKLDGSGSYTMAEVEQAFDAALAGGVNVNSKVSAATAPAVYRFQKRWVAAVLDDDKTAQDDLRLFKADLGNFVKFYD